MLLLDRNTTPENTVYYISGLVDGVINQHSGIDITDLYYKLIEKMESNVNYDFFILALDFLFLIDRVKIDSMGELHSVHKDIVNKKCN